MGTQFWTDTGLEPKRQHRWMLFLPSRHVSFYVTKTAKPAFDVKETEHKFFGHSFFFPGHFTWKTIAMTLVDPFGPNGTTGQLHQILRDSGYSTPSQPTPSTLSKKEAVNALGSLVVLSQYTTGENGKAVEAEKWRLYKPWIQAVNFGALDYNSDAMVTVDVTLRYDYAVMETL